MKRHRIRLTQRGRRNLIFGAIVVSALAAVRVLGGDVLDLASSDPPAEIPAVVVAQIASAAETVVPDARFARPPQQAADGTYQASLVDDDGRCWKVQVAVSDTYVAAPVGQPALVGCWPQPHVAQTPDADGSDEPDPATDRAVRGFLNAYLTGGDVNRWGQPGINFDLPKPVDDDAYGLADSHQNGDQVAVNGWVDTPTLTNKARRVETTWLLTVVPSDVGPVVAFVNAGPPVPRSVDTETTNPPTTRPPASTTTTTSTVPAGRE